MTELTDERLLSMAAEALGYASIDLERGAEEGPGSFRQALEVFPEELIAFARAALAAEPTFIASEPSDEDLADLAEVFNGDPLPAMRRALELWGRPTITALAAEPLAPAPAADGEREGLARLLDDDGRYLVEVAFARECQKTLELACRVIHAAALLRQPAPAPADLTPVAYDAKAGTRIELTRSTPCPLWAVRSGAYRMSIHGEWSVEPMPSSRTADYLAMHSFPSPAAAWAELQRYRKAAASFDGPQPPQGGEVGRWPETYSGRQRAEEVERLCTEAGIDLKSPDAQRLVRDARDGMPLHDVLDLIKHWNATITTENDGTN